MQKVMRYASKSLLLDVLMKPHEATDFDLRRLLRSFVHQLTSQMPGLFVHIRPIYLEHRKAHRTTTEDALWTFLHILLRVSKDWKIVIAASSVHLWPAAVQPFLKTLEAFLQGLESNYLFISSSNVEIPGLCPGSQEIIDLGSVDSGQTPPIRARAKALLSAHPDLQMSPLTDRLEETKLPEFPSITNVNRYAKVLSRTLTLSTVESVDAALARCPRTEDAISHHCVEALTKDLLGWCSTLISWVQKAPRPLRTSELAVAMALRPDSIALSKLVQRLPASIETDIQRHLDVLFRIDGDLVHFYSAKTRRYLTRESPGHGELEQLNLLTHEQLARICLDYITEVVSNVTEETCLAQITWRHQVQDDGKRAELEFLDFAIRHWPTQYRYALSMQTASLPSEQRSSILPGESNTDTLHERVLAFLTDNDPRVRKMWYRLFRLKSAPEASENENIEPLEIAAELGFISVVESLLSTKDAGSDPPDLGKLLCIAVRNDFSELGDLLLDKQAKRNEAILESAELGRVDYLKKLMPNEEVRNWDKDLVTSAIHSAARGGSLLAVEFLTSSSQAELHSTHPNGKTLLHSAAIGGKFQILKHLLGQQDFDLNAKDRDGKTPLMIATQLNHVLFVKELCSRGADVTLADLGESSALHHAIVKDPDIVKLLLRHGASPVKADSRKRTPLHFAVRLGNLGIVMDLVKALKEEESINAQDEDEQTVLHIAATFGHSEIVRFLLDKGADMAVGDRNNRRPIELAAGAGSLNVFTVLHSSSPTSDSTNEALLVHAAAKGELLIVRYLLKAKTATDVRVHDETPLVTAASKGYTEVVRILLEEEADPDFANSGGHTPLERAIEEGHTDAALALLCKGADPNALDYGRWTPLHRAASKNMTKVVDSLLERGVDVSARTLLRDTALHLSLAYPDIVAKLIEHRAELATLNYSGMTPLHIAIGDQYVNAAKLLAKANINLIHISDEDGCTPLHRLLETGNWNPDLFKTLWEKDGYSQNPDYSRRPLLIYAIQRGNQEAARLLLQNPTLAACKDTNGVTPLHAAIEYHFPASIVKQLVELSSEVNDVDNKGETPLYRASWYGQTEIVEYLLAEKNADPNVRNVRGLTAMHAAADTTSTLQALISHEASIDATDNRGWPPLFHAVYRQKEDCVKALVNAGASINIKNKEGQSALHLAEWVRNPRLSEILLEAGADAAAADLSGQTPLHYAAQYGEYEQGSIKVQKLLEKGAIVNCKDNDGRTPLHLVAATSNPGSAELLRALLDEHRKNGCSIDEKDDQKLTPLHWALIDGSDSISQILLREGADVEQRDMDGRSCLTMAAASNRDSKLKVELLFKPIADRETPPWTLDDKVAAFMASFASLNTAKFLAEQDNEIFRHQKDTSIVLDQCLTDGDYTVAVDFLKLGANPFLRKPAKFSPFEQISLGGEVRNDFYLACKKKLQEDIPDPGDQFQTLRMCIELGWSEVYFKIARWRKDLLSKGTSDGDGWTIETFLHQNDGMYSIERVTSPTDALVLTPSRLIIPDFFDIKQTPDAFIFSDDSNEVEYLSELLDNKLCRR